MALYTDIIIDQGSNYFGMVPVKNDEGLPINLTGYSARGQIRKTYQSRTSVDFTASIEDPASGQVFISLTPEQTALLKAGRYVFDVEIYDTDGSNVIRISEGQAEVTPRVTRPSQYNSVYYADCDSPSTSP